MRQFLTYFEHTTEENACASSLWELYEMVTKVKLDEEVDRILWQQYRSQKLGILDVLVELRDGTKIDFEIQVRPVKHWDRRTVFYVCKLYLDNLHWGEKFAVAERAIA